MNEREDYLDRLLRGVEGKPEEAEDEFFSSFGESVSQDAEDDFLKAFEKSRSQSKNTSEPGSDKGMEFDMEDIDHIVSNVKNGTLDDLDEFGSLEDGTDLSIDESLQNYSEDDSGLDEIGTEFDSESSDFMVNTMDGEPDSQLNMGEANQELLDMLSGIGEDTDSQESDSFSEEEAQSEDFSVSEHELSEDGELHEDAENQSEELESAAESLAKELEGLGLESSTEDELSVLDEEPEEEPTDSKRSKKKKKKRSGEAGEEKAGFFKRLSLLLFGEQDEAEPEGISGGGDIENLSDENADILREMEAKKAASEEEEKARKKQEKKEKKEQKKKEKAEKKAQKEKEKKEKPRKEKKVKEPRVVEKTKPLPKGPVFLIFLVGLSLVILINLLTSQIGYTLSISQAKEHYEMGEYVEAYSCFTQGAEVKKVDEELYNKARLTAYIQQQINSYKMYQKQGMYTEALSALICGVGRYDKNANEAAKAGAAVEYEKMLAKLEKALKKKYDMSLEQARELYAIREKEDFTLALYEVIEKLGLEAAE